MIYYVRTEINLVMVHVMLLVDKNLLSECLETLHRLLYNDVVESS